MFRHDVGVPCDRLPPSPCFIHIAVKRRCSVLPALRILPPRTTVSPPVTRAVSPSNENKGISPCATSELTRQNATNNIASQPECNSDDRPDCFPLPHRREVGRRRDGCCLQGRRHGTRPLGRFEIPSRRSGSRPSVAGALSS